MGLSKTKGVLSWYPRLINSRKTDRDASRPEPFLGLDGIAKPFAMMVTPAIVFQQWPDVLTRV